MNTTVPVKSSGDLITAPEINNMVEAINSKGDRAVTANTQTGSYTLVITDAGKSIYMNVAGANNLTVPLNADVAFETGTQITVWQYGSGQTTIVAASGVTIRSAGDRMKIAEQYGAVTLEKKATNEWMLTGNTEA